MHIDQHNRQLDVLLRGVAMAKALAGLSKLTSVDFGDCLLRASAADILKSLTGKTPLRVCTAMSFDTVPLIDLRLSIFLTVKCQPQSTSHYWRWSNPPRH